MLKLEKVSKSFHVGTPNEKCVINKLDLELKQGDFVTVIGGNGAGKSTLLNLIAGVYPIDCGIMTLDGQDISLSPEYQRAKFIGRVFQDPMMGTASDMQIIENLAMAARRGQKRSLHWGVTKKEKEEYYEIVKALGLGLEDRLTTKVGLLSGGQRQALTLLMATLNKPKPVSFTHLDVYKRQLRGRINHNHIILDELKDIDFSQFNKIYLVACGTAYHASMCGAHILKKVLDIPVLSEVASEFRYDDPFVDEKTRCV